MKFSSRELATVEILGIHACSERGSEALKGKSHQIVVEVLAAGRDERELRGES